MTKVYIETQGCAHNFSDSEQMAGLLKKSQFEVIDALPLADIVIFNSCVTKDPTQETIFKQLETLKKEYPYKIVIIAGCCAQTESKNLRKYPLIGINQIHKVVEVVEEALHNNTIRLLETNEIPPLNLPRIRKNPRMCIIPICRGDACSQLKPNNKMLVSYTIDDIAKEVEQAVTDGVREIWLCSDDASLYGIDIKTNLPKLLQKVANITGNFQIRIGAMNAHNVSKMKDELLPLFEQSKIFQFIELPLFVGSDLVLAKMNRPYTSKEYMELIQEIKERVPLMTIATQILVGFPCETDEQHWDTLTSLRNIMPDMVQISRFWPDAQAEGQLADEVIKHRIRVLTDVCHNIFKLRNERWLGWEGSIIIEEKNEATGQCIGRNRSYKPVIVRGDYSLGQMVQVKVNKAETFGLWGQVKASPTVA